MAIRSASNEKPRIGQFRGNCLFSVGYINENKEHCERNNQVTIPLVEQDTHQAFAAVSTSSYSFH